MTIEEFENLKNNPDYHPWNVKLEKKIEESKQKIIKKK